MKPKKQIINSLAKTDEDKVLIASALDKFEICQTRGYITNTHFLDMRQRYLLEQALIKIGAQNQYIFWGGYEDAERVCAIFFPDYMTENQAKENSPITLVRATKKPADELTHRDYLGSIMGLKINRDRIGDILIGLHGADIVVMRDIAEFIKMNFVQAGRKQISVTELPLSDIIIPKGNESEGSGSVASLRLDSVIALVFSLSRSDAQEFIQKGLVYLNQVPCIKSGRDIAVGDKITVRGKGRCKITALGGQSRKGRQFLNYIKNV